MYLIIIYINLLKLYSWRCGETVKEDEQVNLQESMETSTQNVQVEIKKGNNTNYSLSIVISLILNTIVYR